jgi:hypothetical protein
MAAVITLLLLQCVQTGSPAVGRREQEKEEEEEEEEEDLSSV